MLKHVDKKLQTRTAGPFRIIIVQKKILEIDEHRISQKVSIFCVTHASETTNANQKHSNKQLCNEIPLKEVSSQKANLQEQGFELNITIRNIGTGPQTIYVVTLDRKGPSDKIIEQPEYIPNPFVMKYWKRINQRGQKQ